MSPTYIAGIVLLLGQVLPMIGVNIDANALTTTLSTLVQIVAGLVIVIRQLTNGRSTLMGTRPANFVA